MIGASTGYGLAADLGRLRLGRGHARRVLRACRQRDEAGHGRHNTAAFEKFAAEKGRYARSINGDAFSDKVKQVTIDTIKQDLGKVDLVVYSLAAPRTHPKTGETISSTLKPIGKTVTFRGLDTDKEVIRDVTLEPATQEEIDGTVAVMGGEDGRCGSTRSMKPACCRRAKTTAFTYLGEQITHDIYWNGSIGEAKDLDKESAVDPRQARRARRRRARVGAEGGRHAGQLGDPDDAAVPVAAVQDDEGSRHARRLHRAGVRPVQDSLYGATPHVDEEGRLRADYRSSIRKFRRRSSRSGTT